MEVEERKWEQSLNVLVRETLATRCALCVYDLAFRCGHKEKPLVGKRLPFDCLIFDREAGLLR